MCPDIEAFAPLITAVFGAEAIVDDRTADAAPADAPPALRVRLADRSLRGTNPVLEALSQVLELVDGRVTASDVLDLAAREPVRERFGFAEDDLGTLESWVDEVAGALGLRRGAPAAPRACPRWRPTRGGPDWQRLLLGAAMADEDLRMVDGVVPFDGLEGQASDLAGRLRRAGGPARGRARRPGRPAPRRRVAGRDRGGRRPADRDRRRHRVAAHRSCTGCSTSWSTTRRSTGRPARWR